MTSTADSTAPIDVLIIGSGIIGAGMARQIRDAKPGARIVMVDGGPRIGSLAGQHLHDTPEKEIHEQFNSRASLGVQSVYVGANYTGVADGTLAEFAPGMFSLAAFQEDADAMPGAAVSWNVGGMGVHWTAATPWPYDYEVPDFLPTDEWDADLETARRILHVNPDPYPETVAGRKSVAVLQQAFADESAPGRNVQAMPMAINKQDNGLYLRTGPNRIFSPIVDDSDPNFTLLPQSLAVELLYSTGTAEDGAEGSAHVTGARIRNTVDGSESVIEAAQVLVCADTLRTPQLLFASGIRPAALGRYLNEHAFISGRVTVDEERLGISLSDRPVFDPDEPFTGSYWLPQSGADQPFHGQIMEFLNLAAEGSEETVYSIGISIYVPVETRAENRVEFLEDATDAAGMPRMRIHFDYSDKDLALIDAGRETQRKAGDALGAFDPERDTLLLAPGSSLHPTGTVRMGPVDDGTSVVDTDGRVWGFDNLYLGGGGVVPTPLSCNSTLTAMVLAVRTARAAAEAV